ncbi:MAG TPA: DNA polymerase ligase N-terminal domain-containing protein [Thermoanaerobaculia bacterium]|jgi:bifunctional non-homologous end joining protein LigD|nr:DNA polymerase ligase N-terminal domain-containing protein [Thermoanaerobaculia bacterium]
MPDLLKKYRGMRRFDETPEPSGKSTTLAKGPIFVIQKHQASHLHYDFRLEMEGVLKSWAVPKGPSYDPSVKRLAMMTEDHPYDYAAFEGMIPAGNYGGGNVIIWDQGTWELIEPGDDPVKALKQGKLAFRLHGKKMFGEWALVKIHGKSGSKGNEWLLLKHRDQYATDKVDITEVAPQSVVSGKTVEEVSPDNIWESNRKSTRKAPTLASQLAAKEKKTSTKKKAPAARSPAASARSRSSRAAAPKKAAPTRRRPPR